ncbi:MAG: ABC transporter permease [Flavobacteriales bacterium]|nr:ABC transporter permease [Flavobacteriales bacterium]
MNLPRFIAGRMLRSEAERSMSRPIVRIAVTGIAVGVALMILSVAVVTGFQEEIRDKVIGFGSHFQLLTNERDNSRDSERMLIEPEVKDSLRAVEGVKHVQVFATRPGIMETADGLQGVVIKGVGTDYDWTFFNDKLIDGEALKPEPQQKSELSDEDETLSQIVISGYQSRRMKIKTGERLSLYYVNSESDARQRNYVISGIYETGLEEFDRQYVFVDIDDVQRLSNWGIQTYLRCDTASIPGQLVVEAVTYSGDGRYHYSWSDTSLHGAGPHLLPVEGERELMVTGKDRTETLPDTAWLSVKAMGEGKNTTYQWRQWNAGGSQRFYCGGYEVLIDDWNELTAMDDKLFYAKPFYLQTQSIVNRTPEIFAWLDMLDINVWIIMILMVFISIVNMTSALLIIILERQRMIGTLKALGIQNGNVVRIFLLNAAYIISRGMLWGNALALLLAGLQWKFKLITLPAETYYLDHVPVKFEPGSILLLNALTLLSCLVFLVLPAWYATRIRPIRAIRFA